MLEARFGETCAESQLRVAAFRLPEPASLENATLRQPRPPLLRCPSRSEWRRQAERMQHKGYFDAPVLGSQ